MWKFNLFLLFFSFITICAEIQWAQRGTVARHQEYTMSIMKELVSEIERRGFSSLKMNDYSQDLNLNLYNFPVVGTVRYTNGFVISIQEIDGSDFQQLINTRNTDDGPVSSAATRGVLTFREVKFGFDVTTNIGGDGEKRFTGTFTYPYVAFEIDIIKNLSTGEYTSSSRLKTLSSASGLRMIYMPSNSTTEALSRNYQAWRNWDGIEAWARDIFIPIILETARNKEFPEICFNYNC